MTKAEMRKECVRAANRLKPEKRACIRKRLLDGVKHGEVARIERVSETTVLAIRFLLPKDAQAKHAAMKLPKEKRQEILDWWRSDGREDRRSIGEVAAEFGCEVAAFVGVAIINEKKVTVLNRETV